MNNLAEHRDILFTSETKSNECIMKVDVDVFNNYFSTISIYSLQRPNIAENNKISEQFLTTKLCDRYEKEFGIFFKWHE